MAEAVDDLLVKLGLELDAKGFREANNQFANMRSTALTTGAAIGTALGTAFLGMAKMSHGVANSRDRMLKWAESMGVATTRVQQLTYAAKQLGGTEADAMAMFNRMNDLRTQARRGQLPNWGYAEVGSSFNPNAIQNMSLEDAHDHFMRGFSSIQDPDRRRRAMAEYGFSSPVELGIMGNYKRTHTDYQRGMELGGIADKELLGQSAEYTAAVTEMKQAVDGFKDTIAKEMLPGMTNLVEGITGWSVENRSEIEDAFREAMPYLKATATGIGVLVAAQVGTKGIAMLAAAATTSGPAAAVLGLGAFYMDEDNRRDGFDSFTGGVDYYKRWLLRQMGVKQEDDPIPEGWIHVPEFNENTPARPSSPRAIPRSTDRTPNGLTPDELSYRPSPGELIEPYTPAEFHDANRRLMRGAFPGAYAPPPNMTNSNSQSSVTIAPVYNIDASGSTDPAMTEERVRRVIDRRVGEMVAHSRDGISSNVV